MRRIYAATLCIILIVSLAIPVFAADGAEKVECTAYVSNDGSCQVTLALLIDPTAITDDMTFPIPSNAKSVTLNGRSARTKRSGDSILVYLQGNYAPTISYTLRDVISRNDLDQLELTLPLLCGFKSPIQALSFEVTLPDEITTKPTFTSVYYQQNIETILSVTVEGNKITGTSLGKLEDQESMSMTLIVSEETFPQTDVVDWTIGLEDMAMTAAAILAVLYWALTLRCLPLRQKRSSQPPEGLTAGELGCALTAQGADLSMMVLSWAQLGYILIHLDDNGRVVLHKRMEMGNERSSFEIKTFRSLFGKRKMVDGTGYHYAQLCQKVNAKCPGLRSWFRRSSGNPRIFKLLCASIGLFGGVSVGSALGGDSLLAGLLMVIMAVVGFLSSLIIQDYTRGIHFHRRDFLLYSAAACLGWLIFGLLAGVVNVALIVIGAQLVAGLAAAYGGIRTDLGKQTAGRILGLHRYYRTAPKSELQRITRSNPEYFFMQAPFAMALGMDRAFAKRFGSIRLPGCPYLTTGMDAHMNALEWCAVMRRAVNALDARQKRLPLERLLGK